MFTNNTETNRQTQRDRQADTERDRQRQDSMHSSHFTQELGRFLLPSNLAHSLLPHSESDKTPLKFSINVV